MNRLAVIILLCLCVLTACKTTEANYRTAYEQAVGQQRQSSGIDSTIYARIRNQATASMLAVGADSLPLRTEYVSYTKGEGATADNTFAYNIVVGQFKQIFNARQMRKRLMENGWPATRILQTREPLYYVIVESVPTPAAALDVYNRVKADSSLVLRDPMPFVLRPARFGR